VALLTGPAGPTGADLLRDGAVVTTSGSTGDPKRVRLRGAAFRASAAAAAAELGEPGRWVLVLPTDYVAGMNVLARAAHWGTEPLVAIGGPTFSAVGFAAVVGGVAGPLYTSLVPIQLGRLLDSVPGLDALRRFDRILLGGQAPDPALLQRARQEGLRVTVTYGSTETCGGVLWDGLPIGDTEVRIIDERIHLSGSSLADGYVDEHGTPDQERTAAGFIELDGRRWHRTADRGELRNGRLVVHGRTDDVIVSGGVKVSLTAVQSVVRLLPGLADAVVLGVPREGWGMAPAVVTTSASDLETVRDAVAARLGPAARPVSVTAISPIPHLRSGKPDLEAIRAVLAATAE